MKIIIFLLSFVIQLPANQNGLKKELLIIENPMQSWSFVAVLDKNKDQVVVTILKDDNKITTDKKNINEIKKSLLHLYKNMGEKPIMFSMVDVEGKRSTRHKVITKAEANNLRVAFTLFNAKPRQQKNNKPDK